MVVGAGSVDHGQVDAFDDAAAGRAGGYEVGGLPAVLVDDIDGWSVGSGPFVALS